MKRLALLSMLVGVCCSGCVTGAVNPFYTPDTVVPADAFEGAWYGVEKDEQGNDIKTPLSIQGERLSMKNDDGSEENGRIVFFKVNEQFFADLQLEKEQGEDGDKAHLLFKIMTGEGILTFIPLDFVWLQSEIGAGNIDLPLINDEDKRSTLFTASPAQWIEFIRAHQDDELAFPLKEQFTLTRTE